MKVSKTKKYASKKLKKLVKHKQKFTNKLDRAAHRKVWARRPYGSAINHWLWSKGKAEIEAKPHVFRKLERDKSHDD